MAGVDTDGDGVDEIAVIRQRTNGRQRLEIYSAPAGVGAETGPPTASDATFGNAATNNNNIAMSGVDIDGDGDDEIAVIRQRTNGRQRLEIYNAPSGGDATLVARDTTFGNATNNNNNIAMASVDIDGDGYDEIGVIRQMTNGRQKLFIFDPHAVVGGMPRSQRATQRLETAPPPTITTT